MRGISDNIDNQNLAKQEIILDFIREEDSNNND